MRERPILFSGPMVRAILDGRKTQTRRVMKGWNPAYLDQYCGRDKQDWTKNRAHVAAGDPMPCPYGVAGDRLWVRETWAAWWENEKPSRVMGYRADVPAESFGHDDPWWDDCTWIPSIHMPRWASRLTLGVVAVRVERLQEISEDDALAEGADGPHPASWHPDAGEVGPPSYRDGFRELWDSINAGRGHSWESNPWVWVIELAPLGSESAGKE